jgi:hypothetical protein
LVTATAADDACGVQTGAMGHFADGFNSEKASIENFFLALDYRTRPPALRRAFSETHSTANVSSRIRPGGGAPSLPAAFKAISKKTLKVIHTPSQKD